MKLTREIKIGIVFVITLSLFIWGFNFLKSKDLFTSQTEYYAIYHNVAGLVPSNPVNLNGVKIGYIKDVSFISKDNPSIRVKFIINTNINIPKNSIASIYSSDLMGSKAMQILLGNSTDNIKPGDTLTSNVEGDLKEEINKQVLPLKLKAENMMGSIDSALTTIRLVFNENTRYNLAKSFENIKISLDNIKNTTFNVDTLVSTQKNRFTLILGNIESITRNIKNNNEKITTVINNFASISDTLAKSKINQTIANTNQVMTNVNTILSKIDKGEGTLGQLINNDSLYNKLTNASKDLDLLIVDIKQHPDRYLNFSIFNFRK
ncbi:MAG: MlaD family protein [Bacteroidota bacterium]